REGKPILVLVAERADAPRLWETAPPLFDALAARHWPGALTVVCAARRGLPEELTAGTGTVGVRLPADEEVRALVRACGGALTATSANPAGEPPARSAADVERYFQHRIDLVIDGGETKVERPSTVLDIHGGTPVLVREGVVTRAEIEETLKISRR
ncbi:MAG TPA: L-threonylcarbamoyladenylate synthase, partial [Pyrinomonadaceae bacterium]